MRWCEVCGKFVRAKHEERYVPRVGHGDSTTGGARDRGGTQVWGHWCNECQAPTLPARSA